MPSKRIGESEESFRERNKQYCKEYKKKTDWKYNQYHNNPEFKEKEKKACSIRYQKLYNKNKNDPAFHFCRIIRGLTYRRYARYKNGICPKCNTYTNLNIHHFVYTYPIIKEHIEYMCRRCHGKWHKDNKPNIIIVEIPVEIGICCICRNEFKKDPPNKLTCSSKCAKLNYKNLQERWRNENGKTKAMRKHSAVCRNHC